MSEIFVKSKFLSGEKLTKGHIGPKIMELGGFSSGHTALFISTIFPLNEWHFCSIRGCRNCHPLYTFSLRAGGDFPPLSNKSKKAPYDANFFRGGKIYDYTFKFAFDYYSMYVCFYKATREGGSSSGFWTSFDDDFYSHDGRTSHTHRWWIGLTIENLQWTLANFIYTDQNRFVLKEFVWITKYILQSLQSMSPKNNCAFVTKF